MVDAFTGGRGLRENESVRIDPAHGRDRFGGTAHPDGPVDPAFDANLEGRRDALTADDVHLPALEPVRGLADGHVHHQIEQDPVAPERPHLPKIAGVGAQHVRRSAFLERKPGGGRPEPEGRRPGQAQRGCKNHCALAVPPPRVKVPCQPPRDVFRPVNDQPSPENTTSSPVARPDNAI